MDRAEREALRRVFIQMLELENLLPDAEQFPDLRERFRHVLVEVKRLAESRSSSHLPRARSLILVFLPLLPWISAM